MKLKSVFIFVSGIVVGALSGVLYSKSVYNKKLEEDIKEVRKFYENRPDTVPADKDVAPEVLPEKIETTIGAAIDISRINNYGNIEYAYAPSPIEEVKEVASELVKASKSKSKRKTPYVIDEEAHDAGEFAKVVITFYSDGTLADEEDNVVRVEDTVGKRNFDIFSKTYDDMWIRNDQTETDYFLEFNNRTFDEAVGG